MSHVGKMTLTWQQPVTNKSQISVLNSDVLPKAHPGVDREDQFGKAKPGSGKPLSPADAKGSFSPGEISTKYGKKSCQSKQTDISDECSWIER